MFDIAEILATYEGSDGDKTKELYGRLEKCGPIGVVALNLFRACKNSSRAKKYRGGVRGQGSYKSMAYDRKQWAIDNLTRVLAEHAGALGIGWGWGVDGNTQGFNSVLYVDLPTGQVSFHSPHRGSGPDYAGQWDGVRGVSPQRICTFCARVPEFAEVLA